MTTLGKLFRTTAFKLAFAYSIVFALAGGGVFTAIGWNVRNVVDDQIADTIDSDIRGLAEAYTNGGIRDVVQIIERRLQRPGDDIYLVTTFAGDSIVGNVSALPDIAVTEATLTETTYRRTGETGAGHRALVRVFALPGGFRLLVGHDIEERERIESVFKGALSSALVWLVVIGVAGGLFMARRVLTRVDGMSDSARTIMKGDLTKRLPTNGSGDELDRLADALNAMLGTHHRTHGRAQGCLGQYRPRSAHAADAPSQSCRAGAAKRRRRSFDARRSREGHRRVRRHDPHLRCVADDRRGGSRRRRHVRTRRRKRRRPRRSRTLRSGRRRGGFCLPHRGGAGPVDSQAAAS